MSLSTSKPIFSNNDILIYLNFSWIITDRDHLLTLVGIDPNTGNPKFTTKISYDGAVALLSELTKIDTLTDKSLDKETISKIIQSNIDITQIWDILKKLLETKDGIEAFWNIDIDPAEFLGILWIKKLKEFIIICEENIENDDESFWQDLLENNPRILQQLFSYPVIYLQWETYVWGKNTKWRWGQWGVATDLLLNSLLCWSFAVIEIKTPKTDLVWWKYRWTSGEWTNVSYSISGELSWWIIQTLNQIHTAKENFQNVLKQDFEKIQFYHTQSILIVWHSSSLDSPEKIKSFSLFRENSKNVIIITFDELLEKAKSLLNYLQSK